MDGPEYGNVCHPYTQEGSPNSSPKSNEASVWPRKKRKGPIRF